MRLAERVKALRAWYKQGLSGRPKPDVLRHGIVGMRGSMVMRLCTVMRDHEYPPRPHHGPNEENDGRLGLCTCTLRFSAE